MSTQPLVSDMFTLSGEHLDRLRQALKVVAHQARLAQAADYGRNVVDALVETEELASPTWRGSMTRWTTTRPKRRNWASPNGSAGRVIRCYRAA